MFIGTSISTSPTIAGVAGAAIEKGAGKAVKFDATGGIVLCNAAGEAAIGFLILQTNDAVAKGDSVTVQVCARGQVYAGAAVKAGDLLSVDANAKVVPATAGTTAAVGTYVIGQALEAGVADGLVHIDVFKGGKA